MTPAQRPKLLMVTHRFPYPPDRGDRIRTWHTLRHLAARFDVFLACLADEPIRYRHWKQVRQTVADLAIEPLPRPLRLLRGLGALASGRSFTEGAFHAPSLRRAIDHWAEDHRFDAALAVCSSTAGYVQHLPIPRKVLDLVDVDSQKWADYADASAHPLAALYRLESRRLRRCEQQIARGFDAMTVVARREADLLHALAPEARITVAPNGVDRAGSPSRPEHAAPIAIFTGVLNYRPNVEGITWLARHVWPHVLRHRPDATLRIVGRSPARAVEQLRHSPGIEVVGPVPDVRPHLQQATLAVAPLRIARGIQNKILEAMSMALPVVATPHAAAGLADADRAPLRLAEDAPRWVDHIIALFCDTEAARRLGREARRYVETTHAWDRCLQPLTDLLTLADPEPAPLPLRDAA